MSDLAESLEETETKPTTISSPNWTRQHQPTSLELARLTPRSRTIQEGMAAEENLGFSWKEIAASRGKPVSWVQEQLDWLYTEVALQTNAFFPLSDEAYKTLRGKTSLRTESMFRY